MRAALATLLLGLVAGSLAGCEEQAEPSECETLARTVNQRLDELSRHTAGATGRAGEGAAALRFDLAKGYARLAADVGALRAENAQLAPLVRRYALLAQRASAALRSSGQAIAQHDPALARESQASFDDLSSDQAELLGSIHGVCNPPEL